MSEALVGTVTISEYLYAQYRRIGFFFAIVFRELPHDCGRAMPIHAWEISKAIKDLWMTKMVRVRRVVRVRHLQQGARPNDRQD